MKFTALILVAAVCAPGVALASETGSSKPSAASAVAGCQTMVKNLCAPVGSARLAAASGDVLLSRGAGFSEIKAGTALVAGDRLMIKQGSAKLALGPTCQTTLGANSMVTLTQKDGSLCAVSLSSDPKVLASGEADGRGQTFGDMQGALVVGGFVAATGGAVALAVNSSSNSNSNPNISR